MHCRMCSETELVCRELCNTHYAALRRMVAAGEYSWADLEQAGLAGERVRKESGTRAIVAAAVAATATKPPKKKGKKNG